MIAPPYFTTHVLNADLTKDRLFRGGAPDAPFSEDGDIVIPVPLLQRHDHGEMALGAYRPVEDSLKARVRCYSNGMLRLHVARDGSSFCDDSAMLTWHADISPVPLTLDSNGDCWRGVSENGAALSLRKDAAFAPEIQLALGTTLRFQQLDPLECLPLLYLERATGRTALGVSLAIEDNEHFCGSGERFDRIDLFGRQLDLVNEDARGVHTQRAYKNVPLLLSSRGYGIFAHSSARMRIDIGAHSRQTLQWLVEDDVLDLFVFAGDFATILRDYSKLTGFAPMPPLWSFGVWMGKFNYWTAQEVEQIAARLRAEHYPTDVINIDTTWFDENWRCTWEFSEERFPDPEQFFHRLRQMGFRVCMWQWPYISKRTALEKIALENGYVGMGGESPTMAMPGIEGQEEKETGVVYTLDLTRQEAVDWYKGLIRSVIEKGAAAIKTDFGEWTNEGAQYQGIDAARYRNLYALLYQRAVWEAIDSVTGEGLIWARAGWAGCQRYPVHWAGDCSTTYGGLMDTIRGGLHLGLSGFPFWSHDAGGFYGIPDFMNSPPTDDVYLRWTQVAVFNSHIRFHGTTNREPWFFPAVAGHVREWLKFRYALLPYILAQAEESCRTGLPMVRALVLEWAADPAVWGISDQFLFGGDFLVCPVLHDGNARTVYLPSGDWVDFWTGQQFSGPQILRQVTLPRERFPLYVRAGASIPLAEPTQCTEAFPAARRFSITCDASYRGFEASELGKYVRL